MKSIILMFTMSISIIVILFIFSGPKYPHLSPGGRILIRQALLKRWYGEVNAFVATEGRAPESLYDICKKWVQEDTYLSVPDEVYLGLDRGFKEEEKKNLSQEEFFNKQVHFQLLKSKDSLFWVIKERNDNIVGQEQYFINQNGFIFKATCLKQAPDIKEIYK